MNQQQKHEKALKGLHGKIKYLFDSKQAIYLYLDDHHKACNTAFAKLLGYTSSIQWAKENSPFLETFVSPRSQQQLAIAFTSATEKKIASTIPLTWKRKNGSSVSTTCMLVPLHYDGYHFALHFITKK